MKECIFLDGKKINAIKFNEEGFNKLFPIKEFNRMVLDGSDIFDVLGLNNLGKDNFLVLGSGSNTPSAYFGEYGVVGGLCNLRAGKGVLDWDHRMILKKEEDYFLITELDKTKPHHFDSIDKFKDSLDKNPPHKNEKLPKI